MKVKVNNIFRENLKYHTNERVFRPVQQEVNNMYKKIANKSNQIGSNINEQR